MKKIVRLSFILPFFIFCFQNKVFSQCWNNGDLTTHNQLGWDQTPGSTTLTNNFYNVYTTGTLDLAGNFVMEFTSPSAIINYIPSSGAPGQLTSSIQDPTNTSSGTFGGNVLALQLDVDFSDANVLTGNSNTKFGDLVLYGFTSTSYNTNNTDLTTLNGLTVRQYLVIVNALLGNGSSGGFTTSNIPDLDPVTYDLSGAFEASTPSTFAQQHLKKGWKSGDFTIFDQADWGDGGTGNTILLTNYGTVYASTGGGFLLGGSGGHTALWTNVDVLSSYMPASGAAAAFTANVTNPTSTSSGIFGGDVAALKLNIDYSDAGFLTAAAGFHFGDLVIYGLTSNTDLNGLTVRQFFETANNMLGGGASSYTFDDIDLLARQLDGAFFNGTPSAWAQLHLKRGWQNGDLTTFAQSEWGADASSITAKDLLEANFTTVYSSTFGTLIVGGGFTMNFGSAAAVEVYLPQSGTPAALDVSLSDPSTSASGTFGGDVVTLKLNIDFADAGLLGSAHIPFGNLTLCNMSNIPWVNNNGIPVLLNVPSLNGITVRQFLTEINVLLGGGTSSYGTIADLEPIAVLLNLSFDDGNPGNFAQLHLVNGSCDCGNTVTNTNQCPTASAITITTSVGSAVKFLLQGSDPDNDPLTYSITQNPVHGTATIVGSDSIRYTPTANYYGADSIKYQVSDGSCTATATVNITVVVCPQGSGYWKNHPNAWPVSSLMLGTKTYTKAQLITILNTPPGNGNGADASILLADQLIPAKLSIANGTSGTPIASTITHADGLLSAYSGMLPYNVRTNTTAGHAMVTDAGTLGNFNSGSMTTGCSVPPVQSNSSLITINEVSSLPNGFVLEQNHPNPFGNSTIIRYELPVSTHVMLEVYNVMGEKIATLVNEEESAGVKTVQFNAGNRSSGVYYYRLTANKFSETKKMILIK